VFLGSGITLVENQPLNIAVVPQVDKMRIPANRENYPERSAGRAPLARKGVRGKDGTSCPRLSAQHTWEREERSGHRR